MFFVEWKEQLNVSVQLLDNEHKKLGELFSELNEVLVYENEKEEFRNIFVELLHLAREHFSHEEAMMSAYHYPDRDAHKAVHERLKQKITHIMEHVATERLIMTCQHLADLKEEWFYNHIVIHDRELCLFLNRKGVY